MHAVTLSQFGELCNRRQPGIQKPCIFIININVNSNNQVDEDKFQMKEMKILLMLELNEVCYSFT